MATGKLIKTVEGSRFLVKTGQFYAQFRQILCQKPRTEIALFSPTPSDFKI